jgi:UDP-2,3-diacylglucosamine hydrolase
MLIQNNAIFIADAHYNKKQTQLHELLQNIKMCKIETKQIFFMGDIFDFLTSELDYFQCINYQLTSLINELALTHEILYLEGNHDYNLQEIFPTINVIKRENQPFLIEQDNKNIMLAHGDIFTPTLYNLYTSIIRNSNFLKFLNLFDKNNFITKFTEEKLMNKKICFKQNNFLEFVHDRINYYPADLIIEGHFHQGYISDKYINVPSLACDNRYMIYQNNQFSFNTL